MNHCQTCGLSPAHFVNGHYQCGVCGRVCVSCCEGEQACHVQPQPESSRSETHTSRTTTDGPSTG